MSTNSVDSTVARNHVRVATTATVIVALVYVLLSVIVDAIASGQVSGQLDARLGRELAAFQADPGRLRGSLHGAGAGEPGLGESPYIWLIDPGGRLVATSNEGPALPESQFRVVGATTLEIGGSRVRVLGGNLEGGWLVVGQNADYIERSRSALALAEALSLLPLLLFVWGGAILISRRSVIPVEAARQRQLAFTADASHELRTPLAVIEAETSLALQRERSPAEYRETLGRVAIESERLRTLVDELLWLARLDAEPVIPSATTVNVATVTGEAAARFESVAERAQITLTQSVDGAPLFITAPADWVERLLGVLLDNACRYTPAGGRVRVTAGASAGRAQLAVDDSGPGIPAELRTAILGRFRRASEAPGGAGLGLAIADAVVRTTGARWEITESDLGGARFTVTWPLAIAPPPDFPVKGPQA